MVCASKIGVAAAALLASALGVLPHPALATECFCRSRDGPAPMGQRLCVSTQAGWRVAVCVMDINIMSWRLTGESCAPVSRRPAHGVTS